MPRRTWAIPGTQAWFAGLLEGYSLSEHEHGVVGRRKLGDAPQLDCRAVGLGLDLLIE